MKPIEVARDVHAPADVVFGVATDLERAPEVIGGIDAIEVHTPGEFRVGTRWTETRTMGGRQATETMWVTDLTPGRSYVVRAESHGTRYTSSVSVDPIGEGTSRLSYRFEAEPVTLGAKLMSPLAFLMKGMVVKAFEADLADIAGAAERVTSSPSS